MIQEMRKQLHQCIGEQVEVITKKNDKIIGKLSWLSPDRCMAEITLKTGQIDTVMDLHIKAIKKL
ncbi:hypothetical protein [Ammoniphilus resinae]|uniref:Uncharacterized protein n=1 Tax=Ammoniphilus resinae TaxID=861532 RepID=A0ABS4GSE1_9BACL|nr:hypothetical protein [Ammoniphilus resinae]MBP1933164.1 hypothetical protein [Ammoniphilus resinae]